jgi:endo-1,4-beta-xylanase
MHRLKVVINTLVLFGLVMVCCAMAIADGYERPEGPTLKQLAEERGIEIGANFPSLVFGKSPNNWKESPTIQIEKAIAEDQFTIMTAGWEMYPGKSWIGPGEYDFEGCDAVIQWCRDRGIKLHGHGLGYACRVGWFKELPAETEAKRAEIRQIYENYLRDTVSHFAGKIDLWDVCNEQLQVPYRFSGFRTGESYWKAYQSNPKDPASGADWYRRSFRLAHKVDPNAKLILLDFNNEIVCPKSDFMFAFVTQLKAEGVPIYGVGFQMHLDTDLRRGKGNTLKTDEEYFRSLAENFSRFSKLGLELWITEMDVKIDPNKDLEGELERQAMIYGRVMEIALSTPNFRGLKYWGIMDRKVWGPIAERPYLFDENGRAKPAFYAVQKALSQQR